MNNFVKPGLFAVGLAFCLASPVAAQIEKNPVGAINATIGGEAYAGETLDVPSEGTSTADFQSFGPVTTLSIQAHDPQAESIMHNVVAIEISIMGEGTSASIMDGSSISWWPDGMSVPFYLSDGSGVVPEVNIDDLSLEDGAGFIKGSFSALICRYEKILEEPDMDDCRPVEGSFDTALRDAS